MNEIVRELDSRFVAKFFEKEHKNVLRAIDAIVDVNSGCSEEFRENNFIPSSYVDKQGRKRRCYILTKEGFMILGMGFTGKKADSYKQRLIEMTHEMEDELCLTM